MKTASKTTILVGWVKYYSSERAWLDHCWEVPADDRLEVRCRKYKDEDGKWTEFTFTWRVHE